MVSYRRPIAVCVCCCWTCKLCPPPIPHLTIPIAYHPNPHPNRWSLIAEKVPKEKQKQKGRQKFLNRRHATTVAPSKRTKEKRREKVETRAGTLLETSALTFPPRCLHIRDESTNAYSHLRLSMFNLSDTRVIPTSAGVFVGKKPPISSL